MQRIIGFFKWYALYKFTFYLLTYLLYLFTRYIFQNSDPFSVKNNCLTSFQKTIYNNNYNKGQSNLVINGISANWGFRPPISPSSGETGAPNSHNVTWDHTSVLAKCHLIPSNGFSRVSKCERQHTYIQTDRPRYGNICSNRRNRFQRCRLIVRNSNPNSHNSELHTR